MNILSWLSCEFLQLDTPIIDSRKCELTKLGRSFSFGIMGYLPEV